MPRPAALAARPRRFARQKRRARRLQDPLDRHKPGKNSRAPKHIKSRFRAPPRAACPNGFPRLGRKPGALPRPCGLPHDEDRQSAGPVSRSPWQSTLMPNPTSGWALAGTDGMPPVPGHHPSEDRSAGETPSENAPQDVIGPHPRFRNAASHRKLRDPVRTWVDTWCKHPASAKYGPQASPPYDHRTTPKAASVEAAPSGRRNAARSALSPRNRRPCGRLSLGPAGPRSQADAGRCCSAPRPVPTADAATSSGEPPAIDQELKPPLTARIPMHQSHETGTCFLRQGRLKQAPLRAPRRVP